MFDADYKDSGISQGRWDNSDPYTRMPNSEPIVQGTRHPLDSQENIELHKRLQAIYEDELDRQAENRADQSIDEDFYDSIQWREEDAAELRKRGQVPLVYNVIASAVNWVIGTEKRGRTDYKILPRQKDAGKPAERKTQLMKYLSDVNMSPFKRSQAFEDAAKVGIGWMECSVQNDDDGEPVTMRYESWRNMLWDSACTTKDLEDCRYVIRSKWLDLDVAESIFPDRVAALRSSAAGNRSYGLDELGDQPMDSQENELGGYSSIRSVVDGIRRERVRVIEIWYRKPTDVMIMRGGEFRGEIFDQANPAPGHKYSMEKDGAQPVKRRRLRMHVALFCSTGLLYNDESPYRHNDFPFTPIWCYRRGRDGLPYGMIRLMRDIQEDINKRASKALHILSTNKTIMEEGAVEDLDEYLEEVSRPDAVIVKKRGAELVINAERELAPAHLELMSRSMSMIQSLSGVTDENMGRQTNATSGIAIGRRQEQGAMTTAGIFDNLRLAVQLHGQKELSLIEQYFTEQKAFRITNMRGTPEYVEVNDGLPENDIVRTKADFIISDEDWRATIRQAQTEELMALIQQLAPVVPQLATGIIDLLVEMMDIPNREEIVKRIRQFTGMKDPDQQELTPEEQAEEQAKQQAEAEQQALQRRGIEAEIAKKESEVQKNIAAAGKDGASTRHIQTDTALKGIETQLSALQAAIQALSVPGAVRVADQMLHEAGYVSRTEEESAIDQAQQSEAALALQQQAAEQQQPQPQHQPQPMQ